MKKLFVFILSFQVLLSCNTSGDKKSLDEEKDTKSEQKKSVDPEFTIFPIQVDGLGWGYQILKDGKLLIDQQNIPAVQGNKYFVSKEDAEKTANFILEKIKKGFFPPTLSVEELDSLNIIY